MMDARVRGALFLVAVIAPGVVLAQPRTTTKDDGDDTAEIEIEPEASEPAAATAVVPAAVPDVTPAPAEPAAPSPRFIWEPFGYLRLQYVAVQNDPNVAFVGRGDGFELQNARVGVRGKLDSRASFQIAFDGAIDERMQINVPDGKLRVGLRDAYADLVVSGAMITRAGFFLSMIDHESLIPDTSRAFVDKPIESRGIRATEGFETQGLTPGRSLGAALRLDPGAAVSGPRVGFEVAVQNGADEYASNNDNDTPAVSAVLLARFPRESWLIAGARYNPRTVGELPFRQDETDMQGSVGAQINAGPVSINGGGVVMRTSFPTTGGPVQNAFGGHAQLMVHLGSDHPLAIGYRFGILDPSSLIVTDRVMEHTAGAMFGVPRYRMRVQLQLTHVVEQRELSNSRAQLAVEVAL